MEIIQYPYDPTGTKETNLVTSLKTLPRVRNRAFAPEGGPFFKSSVVLIDVATGEEIPKTSYDCLYLYSEATKTVGESICGVINVHDTTYDGVVEARVQVVGGPFGSNVSAIQRMLETLEIDNRKIRFDDLIDLPVTMPPSPHLTFVGDLYGAEAIVQALENIHQSSSDTGTALMDLVKSRYDSLYQTILDLSEAGGSNLAALNEIKETVEDNHTSVMQLIDAINQSLSQSGDATTELFDELRVSINTNLESINTLTGSLNANSSRISSVQNRTTELETASSSLRESLTQVGDQLTSFMERRDNPFQVTATQVGLGNVQNYPIATLEELRAGTASRFVPAGALKLYIDERIAGVKNVTLSAMEQALTEKIATDEEAEAGEVTDKYMTPHLVKLAINALSAGGVGDTWTWSGPNAAIDNSEDYGYIRHSRTGITIQWGQSHSLRPGKVARLGFFRRFVNRPWAILGNSLTWTAESGIVDPDLSGYNETTISVIGKSITSDNFLCVAKRIGTQQESEYTDDRADGAVYSWMAIGITEEDPGGIAPSERSIAITTIDPSMVGNMQYPTHLIAPEGAP